METRDVERCPGVRLVLEKCPIVLAGAWNRAIFRPEWAEDLFAERIQLELAFPLLDVRLLGAQCDLRVLPGRVELRPRAETDEAFLRTKGLAATLLRKLPETPLQGIGVNFGYTAGAPSASRDVFRDSVLARLGEGQAADITVHFAQHNSETSAINMVLGIPQAGEASVDINYDRPFPNAKADTAREYVEQLNYDQLQRDARARALTLLGEQT